MFSYSCKCSANFPSKTTCAKTSTQPVQTTFPLLINHVHLIRRWQTCGAKLRLCLAAQSHSCVRLYTALCQPASHQAEPRKEKEKRRKKKWGSISRPLAFCLNSSLLRLCISLSLPSIYKGCRGEEGRHRHSRKEKCSQIDRWWTEQGGVGGGAGGGPHTKLHFISWQPRLKGEEKRVCGGRIGLEKGRA